MRASQGELRGRNVCLYNPEMFDEHEEIIIFNRNEFSRMYRAIYEDMDYITKLNMSLDQSESWKLLAFWPEIMERIHIIELFVKDIYGDKPVQTYLDAYLASDVVGFATETAEYASKVTVELLENPLATLRMDR